MEYTFIFLDYKSKLSNTRTFIVKKKKSNMRIYYKIQIDLILYMYLKHWLNFQLWFHHYKIFKCKYIPILFSRQNARKAEKIFVLAILLRFSRRNCFPKVVPLTKVTPPATSTDTVKNSFTGCIVVSICQKEGDV